MYLLYLDDSGSVRNPNDQHIILAGICVYEQTPYWLSTQLDELAKEVWPNNPENWESIEFRGNDIFAGRSKEWRGIDKAKRIEIYKKTLSIIAKSSNVRLFGAAVHKTAISPRDPMEYGFEQLCNRFDLYLKRIHHKGDTKQHGQRGLIVFDKSSYETSIQGFSREFRRTGHTWGVTRNIVDVPLFVDSKATRMVQYADLIAYSLRHAYEKGDSYYLDIIGDKFDRDGGTIHGLHHYTPIGSNCRCLICHNKESSIKLITNRKNEKKSENITN